MYNENFRKYMWEIYSFNFKLDILHKILGLSPARCIEYPLAIKWLKSSNVKKLLDIGSGKSCFPLYMVKNGILVTCLDINKRTMIQKKYAKKVGIINQQITEHFDVFGNLKTDIFEYEFINEDKSFIIKICDATNMNLPDSSFDAVSCISNIEHIPNNGDIQAIKEITRVLKKGGKVFISVPYGCYEEGKSPNGNFERRYDYEALNTRLILPSGLKLVKLGFIIDHNIKKFTDLYYKVPKYFRFALGWSCIFFMQLYKTDNANKNDAEFAYIMLEKGE